VIDLVVTDLDGTLWWAEDAHPRTLAAWRTLDERGVPVLVATGRRVTSARDALARVGLAPPAVVLNGAIVLDLATDERFHRHVYSPDVAARVLAAFRAADMEPCVYVDGGDADIQVGARPSTHPDHLRSFAPASPEDLDATVAEVPVTMFGVMGHSPAPLDAVRSALAGVAEVHVAPDSQYGGHSCTVTPLGLSKWVGVTVFCERHGIDPSRVLAIGDGPNDRELLEGARVAVAPQDAHPDALAAADHVVASTRVGGWAEILDLL
jgi:hydroxymethylpyrimidine pyrophosphatase-like HAD family hydrolase